jgi:hypothetical protein
MLQVLSVSRRTDIPAFYSDWFMNRLKARYVFVRHPYTGKPFRVSLQPEEIGAIVFWSKNYAPLLDKLASIERTTRNLFFHFTITANQELEPNVPDFRDAVRDFIFLVRRYSPEQVLWRYDPVCVTDKLSFEVHEDRFARCAELLKEHAAKCCLSFVHPYKKVLVNLRKDAGHTLLELSEERKQEYALRLARRADRYGIRLFACCNDYLVSEHVAKASCIDGRSLSALFQTSLDTRPASTRKECACTRSVDIGAYDTCAHGCAYCYANADKNKALAAREQHDPGSNALTMQVTEEELDATDDHRQQSLFPG